MAWWECGASFGCSILSTVGREMLVTRRLPAEICQIKNMQSGSLCKAQSVWVFAVHIFILFLSSWKRMKLWIRGSKADQLLPATRLSLLLLFTTTEDTKQVDQEINKFCLCVIFLVSVSSEHRHETTNTIRASEGNAGWETIEGWIYFIDLYHLFTMINILFITIMNFIYNFNNLFNTMTMHDNNNLWHKKEYKSSSITEIIYRHNLMQMNLHPVEVIPPPRKQIPLKISRPTSNYTHTDCFKIKTH